MLFTCLFGVIKSYSQQPVNTSKIPLAEKQQFPDSVKTSADSIKYKPKNPSEFDDEISYSATDSIVFLGNGTGFLYGKTDIQYKKIKLNADFVRIKMDSTTIYAKGTLDSLGVAQGLPVFSEGESEYTSKELTYNLKTKKGIISQAVTQQGEAYILSEKTKKSDEDMLCMTDGKYTTCDNHDHPHFYLSLSKAKVKPGSYIVTGPAHLVLLDIPFPIALPFGYFPFNAKYSSGIEAPNFVTEVTRGYGLVNGGYYFAINDYADLSVRGDIYTKGTWGLNITSNYLKKYKFNGGFNITYREDVISEKDLPDYSKNKNFSIRWSHTQDAKVNPFRTFSAGVNFSTSGYNRSNINSYYSPVSAENTKGSSISFSQRFPNNPFSITGALQVDQTTRDSMINLTLPNVSISMNRIYPLKRKSGIGKERWYEKISMSYSGSLTNSIRTKEYKLLKSSFVNDWQNAMQHNIPISATFNLFNYISISPSFNYRERWYLNKIERDWDSKAQKEITIRKNGFNRVYDFNASIAANTTLYGMYTPVRSIFGDKIEKFRHVVTPSIGVGYSPDFGDPYWGYWSQYTKTGPDPLDKTKTISQIVQYSKYAQSLYGGPGQGKQGNVFFSIGNNLEMKVKNPKDTTKLNATKIVSLIDNFTLGSSYNMAADSMRWSNISATLRIKITKSYTLNLSTAFDPYMYAFDKFGKPRHVDRLRWNEGKLPRFLGAGSSLDYTLSNETFKKKEKKKNNSDLENQENINGEKGNFQDENVNDVLLQKDETDKKEKTEIDDDGYEKVDIPWSLSFNYTFRYADNPSKFNERKMEYDRMFTHNVGISGNIKLTPGWQVSATTSYDFNAKRVGYANFNITRNLHCWTLTGSMVPFGPFKTYSFRIGVNASMLQDLKYEKQGGYGGMLNKTIWY